MKMFMLLFTLTEIETQTNKMATVPNVINVSVQYEHLNTVLYKPFLSVSVSVSVGVNALLQSSGLLFKKIKVRILG